MGLNMPAKTCVFTALRKWDGEENRCGSQLAGCCTCRGSRGGEGAVLGLQLTTHSPGRAHGGTTARAGHMLILSCRWIGSGEYIQMSGRAGERVHAGVGVGLAGLADITARPPAPPIPPPRLPRRFTRTPGPAWLPCLLLPAAACCCLLLPACVPCLPAWLPCPLPACRPARQG